jgi:NET1-associated nuclear protein 1 (U3 small nucleolar RNA-associated protein 17)
LDKLNESDVETGNYIISGGSETVLVLWQLDTGKQQFLPHMSATILNVVVSPTGSSYAVQLADNSAMVLSTAELQPTANISGIQISYLEPDVSLESRVQRVEEHTWSAPLVQRTPAVINPAEPYRLLIGVGQTQEIKAAKPQKMSNPFLETFDLRVGHNISRQALARTNITNVDAAPSAYRFTEPRVTHIKISHDGHWLATVDEWTPPAGDFEHMEHSTLSTFQESRHRREIFLKFWQRNNQNETWELISRINAPHKFGTGVGPELGDAGRILDLTADPSSLRFATIGEDGIVRTWIPRTRIRDGITVQDKDKRPLQNWFCQHAISPRKLDVVDLHSPRDGIPNTGLITFSDDGSVLISACSNEEGCLHLIDPDSGVIRKTHLELFDKEIFGLKIVGQDLIILSETLIIFDLVSQEKRFELNLNASVCSLSIQQKQEMIHLAADEQSQTFALALPSYSSTAFKGTEQNMLHLASELVVFSLDNSEPQVKEVFPSVISALIPAVSSEGYLALDTNAEIYTVVKKGAQAVTILAQSTSALQLDSVPEEQVSEQAGDLVHLIQDMEDSDSIPEESELLLKPENSHDDGVGANHDDEGVVTQQQLAQIFDIGPAFALPPIEDMFYQVAGLFSSKAIVS